MKTESQLEKKVMQEIFTFIMFQTQNKTFQEAAVISYFTPASELKLQLMINFIIDKSAEHFLHLSIDHFV